MAKGNLDKLVQRVLGWNERLPLYRDGAGLITLPSAPAFSPDDQPRHFNCRCILPTDGRV